VVSWIKMISSEFENYLANFEHSKKFLQGVYASDTIPRTVKVNHFIICNTDVSSGTGQHWYVVLKLHHRELECFDSLGIDANKKQFIREHFNLKGIRKIKFNVTQLQSNLTSTCGKFVLYFIINRLYNSDLGFNEFLNEYFTQDLLQNETLVNSFFDSHFNG